MAADTTGLITQYIQNAIAAERSFEAQLRAFSEEGDDEEVQTAFAAHARETKRQIELLNERLFALGGDSSKGRSEFTQAAEAGPKFTKSPVIEERLAQNLITAYTIETAECAMYEALAVIAAGAGDIATEKLAREIQEQERTTAERVWHFLPSRSKIAFNMLTLDEVDPSIETKTIDNRLVE